MARHQIVLREKSPLQCGLCLGDALAQRSGHLVVCWKCRAIFHQECLHEAGLRHCPVPGCGHTFQTSNPQFATEDFVEVQKLLHYRERIESVLDNALQQYYAADSMLVGGVFGLFLGTLAFIVSYFFYAYLVHFGILLASLFGGTFGLVKYLQLKTARRVEEAERELARVQQQIHKIQISSPSLFLASSSEPGQETPSHPSRS